MLYNQQTPPGKDPELWELAKRRTTFKRHFATYLIMSVFFWLLWYITGNRLYHGGIPWPVWPMLGWGIGIAFNYLNAYAAPSNSTQREYEKLKNQQTNNH